MLERERNGQWAWTHTAQLHKMGVKRKESMKRKEKEGKMKRKGRKKGKLNEREERREN